MYKIKLNERLVFVIFIALTVWICNVNAQGGNCLTPNLEILFINKQITPGVLLHEPYNVKMANTRGIVSHTEDPANNEKYLAFTYNDVSQEVLISTTEEFLNYEKDQIKPKLTAFVTLSCTNDLTTEMWINFNFDVVNNFAPEFSQASYEIELPLPLPNGIDIFAIINDRISAIDYDLYENQITFTSDRAIPFSVGTSSITATMDKEYFATLLTIDKIVTIVNGMEIIIRATDSSEKTPRYNEATVRLTIPSNYEEIVEVPIFVRPLYIGTLDFQKTQPLDIEKIELLEESISSIIFEMELGGDYYFELKQLGNAIEIKLKETVTENDLNGKMYLSFVVRATYPGGFSGNTAVLINVIPKETLLFEDSLYTGTIKLDMTIDHQPIKLTDATYQSDVEFFIKNNEDYWELFDVIFKPNVNEVQIVLAQPINHDELEGTSLVSLTLLARSAGNSVLEGKSYIVLDIARAEGVTPAFDKQIYSGYMAEDSFELEPLVLSTNPEIVGFELAGEDRHLIKIQQYLSNGVILGLVDGVTIDSTDDKTVISVIVSAILTENIKVSTVALIHVDHIPESCELAIIVSIIVLVVILLMSSSAMFIMWWKWIRPYRFEQRGSLKEQLEKNFNDNGYTEPVANDIDTKSDTDLIGHRNFAIENEREPAQASTALQHSSPDSLANSLHLILEDDNNKDMVPASFKTDDSTTSPKGRKKSIKFNETVERIDILDDFTEKEDTTF